MAESSSPALPARGGLLHRRGNLFLLAALALALGASYRLAEVRPGILLSEESRRHMADFLAGLFPPALSPEFLALTLRASVETVQIALMGTLLALALAFPLSLPASSILTIRGPLFGAARGGALWRALRFFPYGLARLLLNAFRTVPELVWALVFVRAVGLGPFAGVLAIAVGYSGILGKVFSETYEAVDEDPLEALAAGGAGRISIFAYGVLPQSLPNLIAYGLYRWECAIRSSAVLGFVGAGGIGQQLELSMRMFRYGEVATLLLALLVLVCVADALSAWLRKRLR
ncbi:MAG: phosphonate ABC transporter, permease protein PhnE [Nitrospinota bacterium]